ncbi:hypothetical protein JTE90_015392, partial [Oedothorax gibbosus]
MKTAVGKNLSPHDYGSSKGNTPVRSKKKSQDR